MNITEYMKTKITIKDIAREAGVSVATVSYVLNNKTEENRISEDTRKKVLQIVNLLDYTPNQSAKALATNRSRNVAVCQPANVSALKQAELHYFTSCLSGLLREHNYRLIHLDPFFAGQVDNADAIICYDASKEGFINLGDKNFVPLLAFDSKIDDPLFFQILSDYEEMKKMALSFFKGSSFVFASLEAVNRSRFEALKQTFSDIYVTKTLRELNDLKGRRVLVTEDTLYQLLKEECEILYLPAISREKLEKLLECMELAVRRVPSDHHNIVML